MLLITRPGLILNSYFLPVRSLFFSFPKNRNRVTMLPMSKERFLQRAPKDYDSNPKGRQAFEIDRRRHNRRPTPKRNGRCPRKGH